MWHHWQASQACNGRSHPALAVPHVAHHRQHSRTMMLYVTQLQMQLILTDQCLMTVPHQQCHLSYTKRQTSTCDICKQTLLWLLWNNRRMDRYYLPWYYLPCHKRATGMCHVMVGGVVYWQYTVSEQWSYFMPGPLRTCTGDRPQAGKASPYITSHPGQVSK